MHRLIFIIGLALVFAFAPPVSAQLAQRQPEGPGVAGSRSNPAATAGISSFRGAAPAPRISNHGQGRNFHRGGHRLHGRHHGRFHRGRHAHRHRGHHWRHRHRHHRRVHPYYYSSWPFYSYPYWGTSFSYYYRGTPVYYAQPAADGSLIVAVQQVLARAGYYRGAIDGIIGPRTIRAIRAFERSRGLPVDGRIDSALLARMGLA